MKQVFPFSAIVGQDLLRTALMACAVNPSIGGVLVRGDKGAAKSTAARALAAVHPEIDRVPGCSFNCQPHHPLTACKTCAGEHEPPTASAVPFVNLPLGATEDRVIGSLDFEQALKTGRKAFQPGLLASAHRGVLYIDEVNLLPDHLVDSLLDVAASGSNLIEREGITFSHPAQFVLIGTMNLEEGDLRPQLLDRFGLMVEVSAPSDPAVRAEIVARRLEFDSKPEQFLSDWRAAESMTRQMIASAKDLLPNVVLTNEQAFLISTICAQMGVKSLRADMVIHKTARTLAALSNRTVVLREDIEKAAELALAHRCRTKPGERSNFDRQQLKQLLEECFDQQPESAEQQQSQQQPSNDDMQNGGEPQDVLPIGIPTAVRQLVVEGDGVRSTTVRRGRSSAAERGAYIKPVKATADAAGSLAVEATIRHSVLRNSGTLNVEREDLHIKQRQARPTHTILFVVDASGSMAALKRMSAVKGAVMSLLDDAYESRDTVGVISFAGKSAELVLPPTRSTDIARERLESLSTGGTTPLASALELAHGTLSPRRNGINAESVLLVLLTDGRANVGCTAGGDPWAEALDACDRVRQLGCPSLVVDTERGFILLAQAHAIATALDAEYIKLDDLTAENLKLTIRQRLGARVR